MIIKVVLKSGVTLPFVLDEADAREVQEHFNSGKHCNHPYTFEVRSGHVAAWFDIDDVAAVVRETQPEPIVVKAPSNEPTPNVYYDPQTHRYKLSNEDHCRLYGWITTV